MIEIGSKVKSLLGGIYTDMVGTVVYLTQPVIVGGQRTIQFIIEECPFMGPHAYKIGSTISFYERDIKLLFKPIIDSSQYQYCIKCDTLTSNKIKNVYMCCEHKL